MKYAQYVGKLGQFQLKTQSKQLRIRFLSRQRKYHFVVLKCVPIISMEKKGSSSDLKDSKTDDIHGLSSPKRKLLDAKEQAAYFEREVSANS